MALVPAKHKIETKSEVPKRNMIESFPINHATPLLLEVASLIWCGFAFGEGFATFVSEVQQHVQLLAAQIQIRLMEQKHVRDRLEARVRRFPKRARTLPTAARYLPMLRPSPTLARKVFGLNEALRLIAMTRPSVSRIAKERSFN